MTVRNTGTQVQREVVTDDEGKFVVTNLLGGTYHIRVSLTGFKRYEQKGFRSPRRTCVARARLPKSGAAIDEITGTAPMRTGSDPKSEERSAVDRG